MFQKAFSKIWILVVIIVVITGGVLVWQQLQAPEEEVGGVVIPSSLEPAEVMATFVPFIPPWGEDIYEEDAFWAMEFGIHSPSPGFTKGFATSWAGEGIYWPKKDGIEVEPPEGVDHLLTLAVLRYEKFEFASEDYERISTKQGFKDTTLKGLRLRIKAGLPLITRSWTGWDLQEELCQQYLFLSDNFVVYAYGLKEAAEDAMIRVIDRYAIE